ncbi:hypothetical protein [Paenibacillus sp. MMS18-CY102]|uniref:hypothetical protein n=1 Tax=Paenibacillus sp. MMS18-CY102 TaxID=2682849 RepID=UPI0013663C38|nr:hypothetical protein [Paenibacillus sp. MMS18-CY102]MWC26653.1 hypothetical protein [Paenibacillus sp. MMS18-CY102]
MSEYEAKFNLIKKVIFNCSALEIDVIALTTDNRFAGLQNGQLMDYVVSPYCNAAYTWSSSQGSIMVRGQLDNIPDDYQFVDDVIGGQLELAI